MENNTLERFMELLSVPSKTYREDRMVNYLMGVISKMEDVSVYSDEMGNIYATKGILATGYYPLFIAHTDTVHEMIDDIIVVKTELPKPNTFGMTYNPTVLHKSLKAIDNDGNPTGIGGDDKCGIFICLELLRKLENCKVALFVSEETGCVGSSKCDVDFLKDVGYAVQFDAPGDGLITEICSGVRLYQKDGYYNMHTANEFIVIEDVERAIEAGIGIVENLGYNKFEYQYEKPNFLQYGLFNLGDTDDEEEDSFNMGDEDFELDLDYNTISYQDGLLSITDKDLDISVVLTDSEVEELYNRLREVMTKRYWDY